MLRLCTNGKGLAKRIISDKILKHRTCELAINPNYDAQHRGLEILVYNFFDKKTGSVTTSKERSN